MLYGVELDPDHLMHCADNRSTRKIGHQTGALHHVILSLEERFKNWLKDECKVTESVAQKVYRSLVAKADVVCIV